MTINQIKAALDKEAGLVAFAAVCAVAIVALYFIYFIFTGGRPGGSDAWGQFGDFVGGLVNPLIGIITVILVVRTLHTTRREAAESRAQFEKQLKHLEQERVLHDMRHRLDSALRDWRQSMERSCPAVFTGKTRDGISRSPGGLWRGLVLEEPGLLLALDGLDQLSIEDRQVALDSWAIAFGDCIPLLEEIATYTDNYSEVTGSGVLSSYYRRRVVTAARLLFKVGLLRERFALSLEPSALGAEQLAWHRGFTRPPPHQQKTSVGRRVPCLGTNLGQRPHKSPSMGINRQTVNA